MWQAARRSREAFAAAGDRRMLGFALAQLAMAYGGLGDYGASVGCFREALVLVERLGAPLIMTALRGDFATVLLELGGPEHLAEAEHCAQAAVCGGPARWGGFARASLALALASRGELVAAREEARQANEILMMTPTMRPIAWIVESHLLRAEGRMAEAQAVMTEALGFLPFLGGTCWLDVKLHLEAAEANAAAGDEARARQVLEEVGRRIATRAERIEDAAVRERYLRNVPHNARVLAWLGQPASP